MDKSIGILDKNYTLWVKELVTRYRSSQIKAAIKVNRELLHYYWELGKDIEEKLYPETIEGTMPSIKEIEAKLDNETDY